MSNNTQVPLSREAADRRREQLRQQLLWVNKRLNAKIAEFKRALRKQSMIVLPTSREVNLRRSDPHQRLRKLRNDIRRLSRRQKDLERQLQHPWIRGADPKAEDKRSAAPQPRFPARHEPKPASPPSNRTSPAHRGTPPAKRRILAITLPRSRDAMLKRATPLMKYIEEAMLWGEEDAELMAREVAEAVGRATVDRLKRWTDQLEREPSYENIEQVLMDMEIGIIVGADCESYGTAAYERAYKVLIKASEQRIKDNLAWLKRYPNGESMGDILRLVQQAQGVGSRVDSKAQKASSRALIKVAEQRIKDHIARLEQSPTRKNIKKMLIRVQQATLLGSPENGSAQKMGRRAAEKAMLRNALVQRAIFGLHP